MPEEIENGFSQNFNIRQNTFDLTGTFKLAKYTSLNLGYIFDDFQRTGRAFSDMRDYTLRAALDTLGSQYVTVRASFDHTTRIGAGFSEASIEEGGAQPGLRFFDEADRDRNRGALLFVLTPNSIDGRHLPDDGRPRHLQGRRATSSACSTTTTSRSTSAPACRRSTR